MRIIGSGSALASATRAHTSTLFSFGGRPALLIDVGDGTSHALARLGLLPAEIPVVVLSHLHPDHAAGLPGYLQQLRLAPPPSTAQTPRLWLPPLAAERLPAALATFGFSEEKLGRLVRRECYGAGSTITLPGDARLKVLANEHLADSTLLGESFSFQIVHEHRRLYYSADVAGPRDLERGSMGCDAAIVECTHVGLPDIVDHLGHLRPCVLTHIPPELEARTTEDAPSGLRWARDGLEFEW